MTRKLILAGILTVAAAFAQRGGGGGGGGGFEGPSMNAGGDRGGMMGHVTSRMEIISQALNLNRDQKKEVKAAMDEGQKEATPVKEAMTKARAAIAESVASGKTGDELKPALDAFAADEARMHLIELNAFVKIFQTLDNEQKAKVPSVYVMMSGIFKNKNWNEMN